MTFTDILPRKDEQADFKAALYIQNSVCRQCSREAALSDGIHDDTLKHIDPKLSDGRWEKAEGCPHHNKGAWP